MGRARTQDGAGAAGRRRDTRDRALPGGEDFGRFLLEFPGAYFRLGTASPNTSDKRRLHDSRFDIDEAALGLGTELFAQVAADTLYQLDDRQKGAVRERATL